MILSGITRRWKLDNLEDWYIELNHYGIDNDDKVNKFAELRKDGYALEQFEIKKDGENILLLSFNFQLNQLLMLINNPILFPHMGYVQMFNGDMRTPPASKNDKDKSTNK